MQHPASHYATLYVYTPLGNVQSTVHNLEQSALIRFGAQRNLLTKFGSIQTMEFKHCVKNRAT